MSIFERTQDAEIAVLGSIMTDPSLLDDCPLTKESFDPEGINGKIFEVLKYAKRKHAEKKQEGDPFDPVFLHQLWGDKLDQVGGQIYLVKIRGSIVSTHGFDGYVKIVSEAHSQRELTKFGYEISNGKMDYAEAKKRLKEIEELQIDDGEGPVLFSSLIDSHGKLLAKRSQSAVEGLTGYKTGSEGYDKLTGGHQNGSYTLIGARPSIGKTQYVLNDMLATSCANNAAAFFSLEMKKSSVLDRLISITSGIDSNKIRSGRLTDSDWVNYYKALQIIKQANMFIDDKPGQTVEYIWRQAKKLKKKYPRLVIYVDYLQIVGTEEKSKSNAERISYVSSCFNQMKNDLDIPVIAITSVNRKCEERPDKRPTMADIRESGDIEFHGDVIGFLYRDDYYYPETELKGLAELNIAKGRDVGMGTVYLNFNRKNGRFIDMDKDTLYEMQKREQEAKRSRR
ncbi:DnaB-like helicase C-terminal domain-containing protein [Paenibacillus amylolyticus]|uniref:replicative DNA helicase n=1 Tax=Paenibacillus amylolyticus TaxID=1451 RepID=UPI003242D6A1